MRYYGIDSLGNRHDYHLEDSVFKSGGEGSLHLIQGLSDCVAKIYHPGKADQVRRHKIEYMVSSGFSTIASSAAVRFAWPKETLFDLTGAFAGFVMEKAAAETNVAELCASTNSPGDYWHSRVGIAVNLALAVKKAHENDIVIGDMNGKNFLLDSNGYITIVDNDTFVIKDSVGRRFPCNARIPELLPPELQGKARLDYSFETDSFSLAIHIFMLLMNGAHPYTARKLAVQSSSSGVITQVDAISNCQSCFFSTNNISNQLPPDTPNLGFLPYDIQDLFYRAFISGHQNPACRPTAAEWYNSLLKLNTSIIRCNKPNSNHYYPNNNPFCPWCIISPSAVPSPAPIPSPAPVPKPWKRLILIFAVIAIIPVTYVLLSSDDTGKSGDPTYSVSQNVASYQVTTQADVSSAVSAQQQSHSLDASLGKDPIAHNNSSAVSPANMANPVYPQAGDIVVFGSYEQDGNRNNGSEDVEWIVLESNPQKNRLLLISKHVLDKQRYNGEYTHVNWAKSDLRSWLNGTFYNKCFSQAEKQVIITRTISSPYGENKTIETSDPVFCLSVEETRVYFSSRGDRKAKATDYAKNNKVAMTGSYCYWWLRGSSERTNDADRVEPDGSIQTYGGNTNADGVGVRPAIWVDISHFTK